MNDLVSVVVPIYNVEKYLNRCLQSIVNQTYKNLEIILVDDGSPDNCPSMCDDWKTKDSRIKVIHKSNAGLGEARNTGIKNANGKYIFFFDSDDYVALNTVERCLECALKTNADTVVYGRANVYPNGDIEEKANNIDTNLYENESITDDFLPGLFDYSHGFGVSAWSKMFSLDIIKENRLLFQSERVVISEDSMFCLEYFSKSKKVYVIPDRLYFYFKNDKSLSRAYKEGRQIKNDEFLLKCIEKVKELSISERVLSNIKARYHGMTLGTMMQIVRSDLSRKEKKLELKKIYKDDTLRQTLKFEVIKLDAFLPRIFWILLKFRCYFLCDMFLLCNKHR